MPKWCHVLFEWSLTWLLLIWLFDLKYWNKCTIFKSCLNYFISIGGDSGEDEPLGLRVMSATKKLATGEKPEWKRNSKQTATASTIPTITASAAPVLTFKKDDGDDLDLVSYF